MRHLLVAATLAAALPFAGLPGQFEKIASAAKGRVGLRNHLVCPAKSVEIVYIQRTQINLHRLKKILQWNALLLGLHAINVHAILRHIRAKPGDQRNQLRILLRGLQQLSRRSFQRGEAGVVQILHLNFKTTRVAQTAERRRR